MGEIRIGNIILDDTDTISTYLQQKSGIKKINLDDMVSFIENESHTKFFMDKNLVGCEEKDAAYVWLDTGFIDNWKHPLFISCLSKSGYFAGHIIGDADWLTKTAAAFFKIKENIRRERLARFIEKYNRKIESRETQNLMDTYTAKAPSPGVPAPVQGPKNSINTPNEFEIKKYWENKQVSDLTKDVANQIIINKWHSIDGLDRYIKVIGARLMQLVRVKKEQYYVMNKIQSVVCNTGLLNHFGEDVYILYRINLGYNFYTPYKIIMSKTQYIDEGFTKEQASLKLEPITFFDDANHGFNVSIEDINFNQHDWIHIIQERRARFPVALQNVPDLSLIGQIKQCLEIGLKLQKRDGSYAKPIYSASTGSVSWVLPFFANGNFMANPELVMVIAKYGEFYQLKTILPYDDEVKDKIMDMSIYSRMW